MIGAGGLLPIYLATRPVDFRKGHDGLSAIVQEMFGLNPFSGAVFEAVISGKSGRADRPRTRNRGQLPAHLPRVERLIEPGSTMCPCGCGPMTMIGDSPSVSM